MKRENIYVIQTMEGLLTSNQNEIAKYNKALSDSVHNFLNDYNKDKKYAMVLAKSGDNILYADGAYNITNDVIKGLNKAYKGMKK